MRKSLALSLVGAGAACALLPLSLGSAVAQEAASGSTADVTGAWSPYLAGALIGLLCLATLLISDRPLGASSSYAKVGGMALRGLWPAAFARLPYYRDNPPKIDWEVMLILGVVFGAFLAAWSGGELTGRWVPPLWEERFGDTSWLRVSVAFVGGILLSYGARLAGGCTSGHGISGALQLSVGSWIALLSFFVGGVPAALLLYRS